MVCYTTGRFVFTTWPILPRREGLFFCKPRTYWDCNSILFISPICDVLDWMWSRFPITPPVKTVTFIMGPWGNLVFSSCKKQSLGLFQIAYFCTKHLIFWDRMIPKKLQMQRYAGIINCTALNYTDGNMRSGTQFSTRVNQTRKLHRNEYFIEIYCSVCCSNLFALGWVIEGEILHTDWQEGRRQTTGINQPPVVRIHLKKKEKRCCLPPPQSRVLALIKHKIFCSVILVHKCETARLLGPSEEGFCLFWGFWKSLKNADFKYLYIEFWDSVIRKAPLLYN